MNDSSLSVHCCFTLLWFGSIKLSRVFEVAHLCAAAAWRLSPSYSADGRNGGKSTGNSHGSHPFRAGKIAASVANHFASQGFGGGLGFAAGGTGGGAGTGGGVSAQELKLWVSERAPLLHTCLSTFMHTRCFLYGDAKDEGVEGEQTAGRDGGIS